eukprot:COSAG06_NODE_429_length_15872_cov_25.578330_21_plen_248_part_00
MEPGACLGRVLHHRVRRLPIPTLQPRLRRPPIAARRSPPAYVHLTPAAAAAAAAAVVARRSIGINFRTGYLDELHVVELRPSKIARQYAKGWLPIDIVSCLPTSYITQIATAMQTPDERALAAQGSGPANTKIFKILRLLRLAKLLRLGRIKKIIKRHEEEMENLMGFAKLFVALAAMLYISHLVACFWYFVGEDEPHEDPSLLPQPGWITRQMADVWNVTGSCGRKTKPARAFLEPPFTKTCSGQA